VQAEGDAKLAWDQEELSLHGLQALLKQAIEAISFILLLNDYKMSEIIVRYVIPPSVKTGLTDRRCDQNTQATINSLTFQSLFTSVDGRDVARRLVTALIEMQIGQEMGVSR